MPETKAFAVADVAVDTAETDWKYKVTPDGVT